MFFFYSFFVRDHKSVIEKLLHRIEKKSDEVNLVLSIVECEHLPVRLMVLIHQVEHLIENLVKQHIPNDVQLENLDEYLDRVFSFISSFFFLH
jgi:hypothetical protein